MPRLVASVPPGEVESEIAKRAMQRIRLYLSGHPEEEISLVVEGGRDDEVLVVPRAAVQLLANMLAHMARGNGVSVIPMHAMLTTQEAADMLNVSRPYMIGLLEAGKIPYEKVGRHRRIRFEDLLEYRRQDSAARRRAADELSALGQELDL